MQGTATEPPGKRLASFLKGHWHWLFIAVAAALVLARFMPAFYLSIICSDNLEAGMLFRDVIEQGHPMRAWSFSGHSDLFPDVILIFLLNFLLRDGLLALQIVTSMLFAGWMAGAVVLYRRNGGRNAGVFTALVILLLLGFCRNFGMRHGLFFNDLFMVSNHAGTEIAMLACIALCQHVATKGYGKAFWWLSALCFILTASDALFLVLFPIPVVVALLVTRLIYPAQIKAFLPLAGNIIISTAFGFVMTGRIFPAEIVGGFTHPDLALARHSWHELWRSCRPSVGGHFVIFLALDFLFIAGGIWLVFPTFLKSAARRIPARIFLLLLYTVCMIGCAWSAAILTGNFIDLSASRYIQFCFFLPALILAGFLNHSIPWSKIAGRLAAAILCVAASSIAIYSSPHPDSFYVEAQKAIPLMRSIMEEEHIEAGLSDYWFANLITFLSHDQVRLRSLTEGGAIFHWINSFIWYTGWPPKIPTPKFRMIFMARLNSKQVEQRYGPPGRIVTVQPGQEIWIYPVERSIIYNSMFGELTNDPGYSVANEYHVAASLLPSQTGVRAGDSITARAGQDHEGAIIYGPYIHPSAGRYQVRIAYEWLSAPAAGKAAAFDVILWKGANPITLAQGEIPFADTAPHEQASEVRVPGSDHGAFEARVFYRGSGDLRVDSLRVIYLGP